MLSIPPGWYLFRPKDVILHYWNGAEFTSDIAPLGNGRYSSLTRSALRKWRKAERKSQRLDRKNPSVKRAVGTVLPDGYAGG